MVKLEDIHAVDGATTGGPRESYTLLPDPEPRDRKYLVISVDDHIVEPPNMFEGRMPKHLVERGPRVVEEGPGGAEFWVYDGEQLPNVGFNAVAGRPVEEYGWEPLRFDQMRRGTWDIHERVRDLDINGIYASVHFPSFLAGFAGQRMQLGHDQELGIAAIRAWNSFHLEEWAGAYPDRVIPIQLPILSDPHMAADEIRRNAELGFKAVTFSEGPDKLGLPSIYSGHWDPFLAACEETETVVCLHFGSSGSAPSSSADAPADAITTLFGINIGAAVDWLYSKVPLRFPNIKIALSEGGVGWVPALLDRLDHMMKYKGSAAFSTWNDVEMAPSEVFTRNFWVCAIEEPSAMVNRERIGLDKIMLESDYPHADSTWPDTQFAVDRMVGGLPEDHIRKITWENASKLFRHPVPAAVQQDHNAY